MLKSAKDYNALRDAFRWDIPAQYNIGTDCCDRWADASPDRTAIIDCADGATTRRISYGDLRRASNRLANALIELGVERGDRVAVLLPQRFETAVAHLTAYRMGAIALPLFVLFGADALMHRLADSGAKAVITDRSGMAKLAPLRAALPDLRILLCVDEPDGPESFRAAIERSDAEFTPVDTTADDPALLIYTSGTTGNPKGVRLTHASHRWILEQRIKSNNFSRIRMLIAAPCYHMNGLSVLETSLLGNGTAILLPFFEASTFVNAIQSYSVNLITSVPSMMASILDLVQTVDVSSVRQIVMASAPVSRKLFYSVKEKFPMAAVRIAYGITEVGPGIFGKHPTLPTPDFSVGFPIEGISYRLADGVLEIKSPSMLSSYTNKDLKTTSDGYFITEDLFSIDQDGFYYFEGRADDMFVCGGHNIYPSKIESVLEQHGFVETSVVVGLPDDIKGVRPYAFLKLKEEIATNLIKEYAMKNLPIYEIPRDFFIVDKWPLSPIGKIDKKSLVNMATKLLLDKNLG